MRGSYRRLACFLLVAGATLFPGITAAQVTGPDLSRPPGDDWLVSGGDWGNTRFSTLSQINTSNVSQLKGAWMARLNGSGMDPKYSQQATPAVHDGLMFVSTAQQDVFALDLTNGNIVWEYHGDVDPRWVGIWSTRGVAVAEGKVFLVRKDARVIALDEKTGKVVWDQEISPDLAPAEKFGANAPVYYEGLIITGMAGGDAGVRGRLIAMDAKTGNEVWRFYTIPGPGEPNFGTWEGDSWMHGGGDVWRSPAIDPELGMLYTPTGNAWPDFDGSARGGDNLYTSSIVALDARTGQYRWHFQEVHHDLWDYDNGNSPLLFDVVMNGQLRKGLAHAGKTGFLYLLDRTNGQPLVEIQERPVPQEPRQKTSPTQPYPVGDAFVPQCYPAPSLGFTHAGCLFDPFWEDPVYVPQGAHGGDDSAPMAFSAQTGLVYVGGSNVGGAFSLQRASLDVTGKQVRGEGLGLYVPLGSPRSGTLTAFDPTTDKIVWQKQMPYPKGLGSGVLSTAGGLLFTGEPDGNIIALDAQTGDELWRFQTGFGVDAPVMTYEFGGDQYVAIAAGGGSRLQSPRGDAVWSFKLGGNVLPLNAPAAPPKTTTITSAPVAIDKVSIGRTWNADAKQANLKNEYAFGPEAITVPVGTTVTWTNEGDQQHTATSNSGVFDTGLLSTGQSASFTFNQAGTYDYSCSPHPWMLGRVVVQ